MRYSYADFEPGLKPRVLEIITVKVVEVIEVEEIVKKEYDFTWVYITAGCVTPLVIVAIVCLYKKCKKQKAIHKTAMEERQPGYEKDAMFKKRQNIVKPEGSKNEAGPEVEVRGENRSEGEEHEIDPSKHNLLLQSLSPRDESNTMAPVTAKNNFLSVSRSTDLFLHGKPVLQNVETQMSLDTLPNKRSRIDVHLFEIAETDKNIEAGSDLDHEEELKVH